MNSYGAQQNKFIMEIKMNSKKILIIVPTRHRNEKSIEFAKEFFKNSTISDLLFGLDEDDAHNYERVSGALYDVNPRLRLNGTLNLLALKNVNDYEYIGFMGDDHRVRTKNWDIEIYQRIKETKNVVAYGNDLIQLDKLPTAVLLDSNIIKTLGFMSPPVLTHLYLDNFWKELGTRLQTLRYFSDIIIEHMHFVAGKADKDEMYVEVNSKEMNKKDKTAFYKYLDTDFEQDIKKFYVER